MLRIPTLLLFSALSSLASWPQYHGPLFDKSTASLLSPSPQGWLPHAPAWTQPTPLGFSSMTTDKNSAYTLIALEDENGLLREVCLALDLVTGAQRWKSWLGLASYGHGGGNAGTSANSGGDGPRSTPSIEEGRIFIYDSQMVLHCLSAHTGQQIWKADMIREYGGTNIMWKNASSPLLVDQRVIVYGGGKKQSFIAFEQSTGKVAWKSGSEVPTHATPSLASIHGRKQAVFLCHSGMVSVDIKTGGELWRQAFPFKVSSAASPVICGNRVFCSAGYGVGSALYEIVEEAGIFRSVEVWRKRNELVNHWSTPLFYKGYLYGIFGFKEYGKAPLQCVELESGDIQWSKEGFGPGNLIRSGNALFILSDDGQLVVAEANPQHYAEQYRNKLLSGKCWSTPTVSDDFLLIRSTVEAVALPLD
jgi:outer membrane protein assembly factor BamB